MIDLRKAYWFIVFVWGFTFPLFSQEEEDDDRAFGKEIEVVKPYQPRLTDAQKPETKPGQEKLKIERPEIKYGHEHKVLNIAPSRRELPAVSLGLQRLNPLSRTFFKAGYGNYNNILAEGYYNTLRSKDKGFSAYLKHNSGKGPEENSGVQEQIIHLAGNKHFNQTTLGGSARFQNNIYHYYGYNSDSLEKKEEEVRQRYSLLSANVYYNNLNTDTGDVLFDAGSGLDYLFTLAPPKPSEIHFNVSGNVTGFFRDNPVKVGAVYDYFRYDTGIRQNRNIVKARATYSFRPDFGIVKVGFNTVTESDSQGSRFHFYPVLMLETELVPGKIYAKGGIRGDLNINSYQSFTRENPYIASRQILKNTNKKFEIFAGVNGRLSERVSFRGKLSYQNLEDLHFFVNDTLEPEKFNVIYDSATSTLIHVHGEGKYKAGENFNIVAGADYYKYTLSSEAYPWHRPTLKFDLSARYELAGKIRLYTTFFTFNKQKVKLYGTGNKPFRELPAIYDLNAGVSYRFSKKFSVYFDFKNILSKEYEYWSRYSRRGFHFIGGLTLSLY